jgi:hypothetical protein
MTFLSDNPSNPRDIIIHGKAYTPDYNLDAPLVNVYKSNQMTSELANKTKSLPVYVEHDSDFTVGKVVDSYIDENRNLNTFLHISGNDIVNSKLPPALEIDPHTNKRYYTGLSMGTDVLLDESSKCYTTVKSVIPKEVSIVRNPDRPNAFIDNFWLLPRGESAEDFINEKSRDILKFDY